MLPRLLQTMLRLPQARLEPGVPSFKAALELSCEPWKPVLEFVKAFAFVSSQETHCGLPGSSAGARSVTPHQEEVHARRLSLVLVDLDSDESHKVVLRTASL